MENSVKRIEHPAYALSSADVLSALDVSREKGLTDAEAEERRRHYGPNRLRESEQKSWKRILYEQFTSLVVILLLIASVTAAAFGQIVEGIAIAAALVINAAIGFVTEYKALQSMEALRRIGQVDALVRRGGETREVPADALVPGDIVLLTEGEVVPADLRLLSTENLQADESALTGESVPVDKTTEPLEGDEPPLAERSNMVFSGTSVSRGAAEGVVVATGMDTEIGRISELVEGAEDTATPLERRLERLGQKLIYVVIAVGVVVAGAGIAAGKELFLMIETAIILAIAAVPEGLPIVSTVALGRGMWRMARRNALVKRLSAVETLGATTVIFTDKTGTLTENSMVMRRVALPAGDIEVVRDGEGTTLRAGDEPVSLEDRPDLAAALRVGVLCGNVERAEGDGGESGREWSGDPTEVALVAGGVAVGLDRDRLRETLPEEREESFDTATKMMATFHAGRRRISRSRQGRSRGRARRLRPRRRERTASPRRWTTRSATSGFGATRTWPATACGSSRSPRRRSPTSPTIPTGASRCSDWSASTIRRAKPSPPPSRPAAMPASASSW